jgi:hypothetical protein
VGGEGTSWWPGLPAPPTEDQARAVLAGWARRTRLVPNTLFDGPLVVEDASVVWMEVARLLETRTEAPARVPGRLGRLPTYEDLGKQQLDGEEWQERDWHGVRKGSVREATCEACGGRASLACGTCHGQGGIACQKKVTCPECRGTGWVDVAPRAQDTCPDCRGSGLRWCPRCQGDGVRPCTNSSCTGGRVACTSCGQTGRFTSYRAGRIHRWIHRQVVEAGAGLVALEPADRAQAQLLLLAERTPELAALPPQLRDRLAVELSRRPPGELRRRVQLFLLPVVLVRYRRGDSLGTAYLVGPARRVHAPDAGGLGGLVRAWWGGRRR